MTDDVEMLAGAEPAFREEPAADGARETAPGDGAGRPAAPTRAGAARPGFLATLAGTARAEVAMLATHPRFALAVGAILFFPALYLMIYLGGVWDPAALSRQLTVGILNADRGTVYRGEDIRLGESVVARIRDGGQFTFRDYTDEERMLADVEGGRLAFALFLAEDFSASTVPGREAGAGQVRIVFSEGNNYSSAAIVRKFAEALTVEINRSLNETRWLKVLDASADAAADLTRLRDGVARLTDGAARLDEGLAKYRSAAHEVAEGFGTASEAVRTMRDRLPAKAELDQLAAGARKLAAAQGELSAGLGKLAAGSGRLEDGLGEMRDKAAKIPFVGKKLSNGAARLGEGAAKLERGLVSAQKGARQLARGARTLSGGTAALTSGVSRLGDGIRSLADALPADADLDKFAGAADDLAEGAARLSAGVAELAATLPDKVEAVDGVAAGLALSVEPVLENLAPVDNNGLAFVPSMMSVASWIGAVILANMLNLRAVPASVAGGPSAARALGKIALPAAVVVVQSGLVALAAPHLLHVEPIDPVGFWVSVLAVALTFLAVVCALIRRLGDAGKLIAVLLLTLQMTAGGGVLPAELTSEFYRAAHAWLPFTFAVEAYRASVYGALGGDWIEPARALAVFFAAALGLAMLPGGWKAVADDDLQPAIDL